eukprot:Gb_19139 [translate_table: standard]
MERLRRNTRSRSQLLVDDNAVPNRLGRAHARASKRQNVFLHCQGEDRLEESKRQRFVDDGSRYIPVKDLRSRRIFSPAEMKPTYDSIPVEKGKPTDFISSVSFNSSSFDCDPDIQIVVSLPLMPNTSLDTVKSLVKISSVESQYQNVVDDANKLKGHQLEIEEKEQNALSDGAILVPGNEMISSVDLKDEETLYPFKPFNLVLALDTDSEDLNSCSQWNADNAECAAKEADCPEENVQENDNEASSFEEKLPSEDGDLLQRCATQVFDKMSEPVKAVSPTERFACMEPLEEDSRDAQTEGVRSGSIFNCVSSEKQGENRIVCKAEQLRGIRASGPSSRWLFSGSRFAAFLRSAVGIIETNSDEPTSNFDAKAPEVGCDTPPMKDQPAKLPAKRKVALSPSSQLKLLQASNSSSYRRMLPFCTELAKDLARASVAQSTQNSLPRPDSTAPEGCDMRTDEDLSRDPLPVEHVKHEENGGQLEQCPSQLDPSPDHSPEDYSHTHDKEVLTQSCCTDSPVSSFSDDQCSSPPPVQKSMSDADNVSPHDLISSPLLLPGPADSTCFSTYGEIPSPLNTPASVPSKGILKVSPRLCKGLCMCPDCASFRLQAERASDFFERQLQEVEMLAVGLMNELANMRVFMEKSLVAKPNGVGFLSTITNSEVKGASSSALKAEEAARSHLMQITRDCSLHCKIMRMQQRRVKFADQIEVKLFESE